MSVVILGDLFTFPEGDASTNRVHTYAKGLKLNDINVHVIAFGNVYSHFGDGEINGVRYYHPFNQTGRSRYFVVRTLTKIRKYIKTLTLVRRLNRQEKIKAIIVYSLLPATFFFSWLLTALTGSKLIKEISEHPLRFYESGPLKKLGPVMIRTESRLVDGIFCISHFLLNFYKSRDFPLHKLMLVPSTVDPERFSGSSENPLPFTYVGYFGTMTFERDNIDILVRAFANVACKYPELHLVLGGLATDSEKEKIKLLAANLSINGRLKILDYMPREEIIRYIMNSQILVMVRADDVKLNASFPSKLAEYLSTGKPVVTVNVGEISRFLTDGVNAFIVEPGDSNKLAEKIELVLSGYDSALIVGQKGKQLTDTVFNYNYQAKRIIPFIESLYKV